MFSILHKTNFKFSVTFILLSAHAFNLEQSNMLLFGKELIQPYEAYLEFNGFNSDKSKIFWVVNG